MDKIVYKVNNQTIPENHTQGCTDNETQTLSCLNEGSCFVVFIVDRIALCAWVFQIYFNKPEQLLIFAVYLFQRM